MAYLLPYQQSKGSFDFDLLPRNQILASQIQPSKIKKTGTTIVGIHIKDGIILAADTKATAGFIVAQKRCIKIHQIAPNIYCAGAGTAADLQHISQFMKCQMEMQRYNSGRQTKVISFVTRVSSLLGKYKGYLSAYLIAGGYDSTGPYLINILANGRQFYITSYSYVPFTSLGSGSLHAMTILQSKYKDDLNVRMDNKRDEGIELVTQAISAGILHDLGSGGFVDFLILTKGKVQFFKNTISHKQLNVKK